MGKLNGKHVLFRFVPTMGCNLRCSYCFVTEAEKKAPGTMFDKFSPKEWIEAMGNFVDNDVEFYMWGGEPFSINETFEVVDGFSQYKHVKWGRVDHNMTKVEQIVSKCPSASAKLRILASWHTEKFSLDEIKEKVILLKSHDLLGMLNFVASDENMAHLKSNNYDLNQIINYFMENGIFMNVAADFNKGNDENYKKFILNYTTEGDWDHIHGGVYPSYQVPCDAATSFFYVENDGSIRTCANNQIVGNFFSGKLKKENIPCGKKECRSLISYCHRLDNDYSPIKHIEDYVLRNTMQRRKSGVIR